MPVRIIGLVPILLGVLILVAEFETRMGGRSQYGWSDWITGPAIMVVGVGLLLSQRWAWGLAILGSAATVVFGVIAMVSAGVFGLMLTAPFWVAGVLVLGALLSRPTRRWALKLDRRSSKRRTVTGGPDRGASVGVLDGSSFLPKSSPRGQRCQKSSKVT